MLSVMQRNPIHLARLLWALGRLTGNLDRLAQVFEINDHMMKLRNPAEESATIDDFLASPAGPAALRSRLRLGREDLLAATRHPPDTLGGAYGELMRARGLSLDAIPRLEASSDIDYIVAHYYETHDLWHVVTGFDTDPAGEVGLQTFYLAQGRAHLPLFVIASVLMNTALHAYDDRGRRLDAIARGWTLGKQAKRLAGIDWRLHFARPLAEIRRDLGLDS
jgi:ubiquinone biosynthesis protein COQ4